MLNIYTREFCPNCDKVKDYLKNKGIEYKELDVDYFKNKAKLVVRGFLELPVIENNGKWKEFSNISIEEFIGD